MKQTLKRLGNIYPFEGDAAGVLAEWQRSFAGNEHLMDAATSAFIDNYPYSKFPTPGQFRTYGLNRIGNLPMSKDTPRAVVSEEDDLPPAEYWAKMIAVSRQLRHGGHSHEWEELMTYVRGENE